MNDFVYHNIFETKGIEYMITILFFGLLIPFWLVLNRKVKVKVPQTNGVLNVSTLKNPLGIFFSKNQTWAFLEKSGQAKIGLNEWIMRIVGDVKITPVVENGAKISKGDLVAEIHKDSKILRIFSPISGKLMKINSVINDHSQIVSNDPYGSGWLLQIAPSNWIVETQSFLLADKAFDWFRNELERFKNLLTGSIHNLTLDGQMVMQDGGELLDQPLKDMPEQFWQEFQENFLNKME